MHDSPRNLKRQVLALAVSVGIVTLTVSVSVAFASLVFSGTTITGDSNSTIDATGTITIGASQATGITIGRSGITASFPGSVTIAGTTTTLQNLIISGTCTGCGIGNFTAGGDLSGSSTSQTVVGFQGRPVSSTAPSANQVLTWNGSFWTPGNVSSTGGITAINGLSNTTTSIVGAGTVTISTSSPNIITITDTSSGSITINSLATSTFQIQGAANQITVATSSPNIISLSLPQSIGTTSAPSFGGLVLNGNATTTNLTITGLGSSGTPCLSVNVVGNVATTTCGSGSSQWTTSSGTIYYNGGSVGIGTTTPAFPLDVNGTIDAWGNYDLQGQTFLTSSSTLGNTFLGFGAGSTTATGTEDTAFGYHAGQDLTTPAQNGNPQLDTIMGYDACPLCSTTVETTVYGADALASYQGNGAGIEDGIQMAIGSLALELFNSTATTDTDNVGVGQKAWLNLLNGYANVAVGNHAGDNFTSGSNNIMIGDFVGDCHTGCTPTATGTNNIAIGGAALASTNGSNSANIAIGYGALNQQAAANENVAIGVSTLGSNATGSFLTAVGYSAGFDGVSSTKNSFFGFDAGFGLTGSDDSVFGASTVTSASGANNLAVFGYDAGMHTTGGQNSFFGAFAGSNVSGGTYNTCLGYNNCSTLTTGAENTVIGASANVSASGSNFQTVIGYGATGTINNSVTLGRSSDSVFAPGSVGIAVAAVPATQLQVGASSTVRLGVSNTAYTGCIEMYDSVNTSTLEYIYTASGVLTATTTKPSFCQ